MSPLYKKVAGQLHQPTGCDVAASAALGIASDCKSLRLPRVASGAAITTSAMGLLVFQTGAPAGVYYNADAPGAPDWQQLTTMNAAAVTASNGLTNVT